MSIRRERTMGRSIAATAVLEIHIDKVIEIIIKASIILCVKNEVSLHVV